MAQVFELFLKTYLRNMLAGFNSEEAVTEANPQFLCPIKGTLSHSRRWIVFQKVVHRSLPPVPKRKIATI